MTGYITAVRKKAPKSWIDIVNLYSFAASLGFAALAGLHAYAFFTNENEVIQAIALSAGLGFLALAIVVIVISLWANLLLGDGER